MLNDRMRGLSTLHTVVLLCSLSLWFIALALILDIAFGMGLLLGQINFVIYELGIATGLLFTNTLNTRNPPSSNERVQWAEAVRHTNKHLGVVAIVVLGIIWATKDSAISRQFVAIYFASSWVILLLLNRFLFNWFGGIFFRGTNNIRTVLVGATGFTPKVAIWVEHQRMLGVEVVGLVSVNGKIPASLPPEIPLLGDLAELERVVQDVNAGQLIFLETQVAAQIEQVMKISDRQGCRLLIFNHWEDYFKQPLKVIQQGELTFFAAGEEPLQNPVNRLLKRLLDISISLPVVLIVLPPLAVFVKLGHWLHSPGPLLYRQIRTGHSKVTFRIYKFRTLHPEGSRRKSLMQRMKGVNPDGPIPADEVARRFRFGNFLRRTSLDEFPQFLNVLMGHMSIVGPRPHMLDDDRVFSSFIEVYRVRHFVKPGITGLAQQMGYRGQITRAGDLEARIQMDLEYIRNWSVWLDIGIILKTASQIVFPPKNAK